jgi:hypothetical protein
MPADGSFTPEERGTGNRATLTPFDRAFLESPPVYEESAAPPRAETSPPRVWVPSAERRASARRLFAIIGGSATLVLALALVRLVWAALLR